MLHPDKEANRGLTKRRKKPAPRSITFGLAKTCSLCGREYIGNQLIHLAECGK